MITTRRTLELNNRVLASIHNRGNEESTTGPVELDSHADTCCAGSNCVVIEHTGKVCNVVGFNRNTPNDEYIAMAEALEVHREEEQLFGRDWYDPSMGSKTYQTVSGALAFDHPMTGRTYLLVFHQ